MEGTGRVTTPTNGIRLDGRYLRETGPVYLSRFQALVRLPIEQNRRADRRAGLRIGTLWASARAGLHADGRRLAAGPRGPRRARRAAAPAPPLGRQCPDGRPAKCPA
jgi:hypothetical protein